MFILSGCYNNKMIHSSGKNEIVYSLPLPRGFKRLESADYHGRKLVKFNYPDSSCVFITDKNGYVADFMSLKYGDGIYVFVATEDTVNINGLYKNKYWREIKKNNVIYGYSNVSEDRRAEFDMVINNMNIRYPEKKK
ncbi:hypothetical protein PK28_08300 [Hymenobacter sp. DG25B]|nr:hypothetical protein PK28_08300 [Hymenobacter sp. DG25B]